VPDAPVTLGQQRALDAITFGLDMRRDGYNLFVLGATGSGRLKLTQQLVEQRALQEGVPSDFCTSTTSPCRAGRRCCAYHPDRARACARTCSARWTSCLCC